MCLLLFLLSEGKNPLYFVALNLDIRKFKGKTFLGYAVLWLVRSLRLHCEKSIILTNLHSIRFHHRKFQVDLGRMAVFGLKIIHFKIARRKYKSKFRKASKA